MSKKTYEKKLYIDMPFDEALERFAHTDPKEIDQKKAKASGKKPPASDSDKAPPKRRRHLSESKG